MKKTLIKDSFREIRYTFKRFLSILLIVFLGVGFFAGVKATSPDMEKTLDAYFDQTAAYDIEVLSTLGLKDEDIAKLKEIEEIENLEASYSVDALVHTDSKEIVVKVSSVPETINNLTLLQGKLPEAKQECVVEESFLEGTSYQIGDTITIEPEMLQDEEGNDTSMLTETEFTIVGTVQSPLYISHSRGSSKLGSGKIKYYLFVPKQAIDFPFYTELYMTVKDVKQLNTASDTYTDTISEIKEKVEAVGETRKQERYDEIVAEANQKVEDAQKTLDEEKQKAETELSDAEKQIADAKSTIESSKAEVNSKERKANQEFASAEQKLQEAKEEIEQGEASLQEAKKQAETKITEAQTKLEQLSTLQEQYTKITSGLETLQESLNNIKEQIQKLDPEKQKAEIAVLEKQQKELQAQQTTLQAQKKQIETAITSAGLQPDAIASTIATIQKQIETANQELTSKETLLNNSKKEIETQEKALQSTKKQTQTQIANARAEIEKGEQEIAENEAKLEDARKEADEKIADAQTKLDDAKDKIKQIEKPEWYILTREENQGYVEYLQDADRIANIGKVFPIVFFVVAALISLTSMNRMVEEQRGEIGTLKALGYNKVQIASKYILYALLATVIGSVLGMCVGFQLIPGIIIDIYGMMYTIPETVIEFNTYYAVTGLLAALLCTVGATIYTCVKELMGTPAKLMRPKAPKPGKRVLLEKIPFLWSRLKFSQKVTVRNIFRYKKRFLMTIIGVMGCTSLIVAGFALRDSVTSMIPSQYGEIFKYDLQVSIRDDITREQIEEEAENLQAKDSVSDVIKVNMQAVTMEEPSSNQDIQLIVPEEVDRLQDFIVLRDRKKPDTVYSLSDTGVILTEKLATLLDIKVGDTIRIKNSDDKEVEVTVDAITENYLLHYIYMSPNLYNTLYGENVRYNDILGKTTELTEEKETKLATEILQNKDTVSGVTMLNSTQNIFEEIMGNMDLVVWILIIAAGLLAFTVLYNLSNVNISERIRELATIKVLGFYDKEVYNYVTRETVILTVIGMLLGAVMGYFLSMFIIKTCELDMLMFDVRMSAVTYVLGITITLVFATIVNIATYLALRKIDMIESLKSVE